MAPRRQRGARASAVKKNIAIGQAHIKSSFNNTIVALTDNEGNVIVWESAGSAGFKGSRKSTPFAAQVTAGRGRRRAWSTYLQKVEVFVNGPGSGRETVARCRPPGSRSSVSRDGDAEPTTASGPRRAQLVARDTPDPAASSAAARARLSQGSAA